MDGSSDLLEQCRSQYTMRCSEEGAGLFGKHARDSNLNTKINLAHALEVISSVPYVGDGPFTLCDYGVSDGGPSMYILPELIRKIQQLHGAETEISVIYEDQATNDFKSLFRRIYGLLPGEAGLPLDNVFPFASGTSFYQQCCPASSVHFGHSNFAVMILSKSPCALRDVVHCNLSQDPEEKRIFSEHAARDWSTFLEMRAKELVPGGVLLVSTLATDEQGNYTCHSIAFKNNIFAELTKVWKGMADETVISEEEFQEALCPAWDMTEGELRAPFEDVSSPPYRLGLRLESCDIYHLEEYSYDHWIQEQGLHRDTEDSARMYARTLVTSVRHWAEAMFLTSLSGSRTDADNIAIMDLVFRRYEDVVARNPAKHVKINVVARLLMRKAR